MIRHLLILEDSGLPLFTRSYDSDVWCCEEEHSPHSQVTEKTIELSGFFVAIRSLAKEFGGNLEQIKLGSMDVYFHQLTNIVSVLLTKPSDDPITISNYKNNAQKITELFINRFRSDIANWGGNVEIFKDFQNLLSRKNVLDSNFIVKNLCNSCISTISGQITQTTV